MYLIAAQVDALEVHLKCEVDALGVMTICRGCFERCLQQ